MQSADKSLPAALYFPLRQPAYVIGPVYRAVIAEPVDHHQARLLRRSFLKQYIVTSHIDAEDDQVIEQILPEILEVGEKFSYRITPFEMPPQGSGNTTIKIRDQVDDKTFPEAGFQLAIILWYMLKIGHLATR